MPESELKDSAINGFVGRLAWENPTAATTWQEPFSKKTRVWKLLLEQAKLTTGETKV